MPDYSHSPQERTEKRKQEKQHHGLTRSYPTGINKHSLAKVPISGSVELNGRSELWREMEWKVSLTKGPNLIHKWNKNPVQVLHKVGMKILRKRILKHPAIIHDLMRYVFKRPRQRMGVL